VLPSSLQSSWWRIAARSQLLPSLAKATTPDSGINTNASSTLVIHRDGNARINREINLV